jgi:N-acetyl-anhydromuramyl-L-alanine amidase AmpD
VTPLVIPGVPVQERRHSRVLQQPLVCPRRVVMLHYDDSSRDDWAVAWFSDPRCTNGYTWLVLDDGTVVELADPAMRTPHAGPCLTPNANSSYYGVAAATNGKTLATPAQVSAIVAIAAAVFAYHVLPASEARLRIVGHDAEAVWTAAYTSDRALWGTVGRKVDPTGTRTDGVPIIDIDAVRRDVARRLG